MTLIDRSGSLRRNVTGDSARKRELGEQPIDLFDGVLVDEAARLRQQMVDDRDRQRGARHDHEHAISQGVYTLGAQGNIRERKLCENSTRSI